MSMTTTWQGSTTCDVCSKPITGKLYDAASTSGPWGTFCEPCWRTYTYQRLGTGQGQRYEQRGGVFVKTAG